MKIATYNVEFLFDEGEHVHSGHTWQYKKEYVDARIDYLAGEFLKIDADYLFLNEVASEEVLKRIIAKTGIDYSYFLATPDPIGSGNAVLYKNKEAMCTSIPAVSSLPVFVEGDIDTLGPRVWPRKDHLHLETTHAGKRLHLLGLHLKTRFLMGIKDQNGVVIPPTTQIEAADSLIRSDIFTLSQARRMRLLIDEIFTKDKDAQVIVLGDFNSLERDAAFRMIQGELKDLPDSLVSAAAELSPEKRFSFGPAHNRRLIDHMLLSKDLEPKIISFSILNEALTGHTNIPPFRTFIESDHAPLVLELS